MSIIKLSDITPSSYPVLFFDAQIWIAYLKQNIFMRIPSSASLIKKDNNIDGYLRFFGLYMSKSLSSSSGSNSIAVTSMLFSEIINTYMRRVAMPLNYNTTQFPCSFKCYREDKNSNYKNEYQAITDDIISILDTCNVVYVDDCFSQSFHPDILRNVPLTMDYNDFYYEHILSSLSIPIVTADKDFRGTKAIVIKHKSGYRK